MKRQSRLDEYNFKRKKKDHSQSIDGQSDELQPECGGNSSSSPVNSVGGEDYLSEDDTSNSSFKNSTPEVEFGIGNENENDLYRETPDKTGNRSIPSCPWTIYKVDNERIYSSSPPEDIEELQSRLEELLKKDRLQKLTDEKDECCPFTLLHYAYLEEKKENIIVSQVGRQRGREKNDEMPWPGNRTSGNILVYFRIFDPQNKTLKGKKIPEAFLLCKGHHFQSIRDLVDPIVRTPIARKFMDGTKIKEYETKNIAGPTLTSKTSFKNYTNISLTNGSSFTDVYLSAVTGLLRVDSDLYEIVLDPKKRTEGEEIALSVGLNFVRVEKKLSYKTLSKVLELFSKTFDEPIDALSLPILDAIEYVQRLSNTRDASLNKHFSSITIGILSGEENNDDFYLSDSVSQHWIKSSEFSLYDCSDRQECIIGSWSSAPSINKVIDKLKKVYKTTEAIRRNLEKNKIKLSYSSANSNSKHPRPIQHFVHGCMGTKDGLFVRLEHKWYIISSLFSQIIDKRFCDSVLEQCILTDKRIKRIMKYPWYSSKKTLSHTDFLELVAKIPDDELDQVFKVFTSPVSIKNDMGNLLLTQKSSLVPKSTSLSSIMSKEIKELEKANPKYASSEACSDKDQNTLGKKKKEKHGLVRKMIFGAHDIDQTQKVCKLLPKQMQIMEKVGEGFQVQNAFVTPYLLQKLKEISPKLKERSILGFLKSMSVLNEDEFNELFLLASQKSGFVILQGDKITPNNIELFDVLIHDEKEGKTYLFQNKKGFDHVTRDACGQIRNSADLLWHDFVNNRKTHVELFWSIVMSGTDKSVYNQFLVKQLRKIGREKFLEMFNPKVKLVFVLSIALNESRKNALLEGTVHAFTKQLLQDNGLPEVFHKWLTEMGLISRSGFLTDVFICLNQKDFVAKCQSSDKFQDVTVKKLEQLHRFLKEHGKKDLSTVAKQQVLSLFDYFTRFHIGHGQHFELKLHVIDAN